MRKDHPMKKGTLRQILVVVATLATILVNVLASTLPLGGKNTGEISDQFQVFFVPAGYVFSIWGLIYLGLIAYTIYQALPGQRDNATLDRVGFLYVGSALANIIWLFTWHYEVFALTIVFMLALLVLLIAIYLALGTGRTATSTANRWLVRVPFSIYLGWITVATVANATSLFSYWGWGNGYDTASAVWAAIMIVVATVVAVLMSLRHGDIAYIAVIVWAFAGIAVKHSGNALVATTAWVMAAVAALSLIVGVPRARKRIGG
jgi:benzodiazapine receptor